MIYDYYLSEATENERYGDVELAGKKEKILNKLKEDKNINEFYPKLDGLQNLPKNSMFLKLSFTLKKPYTSRDEGEFHIINGKIFENPIVRDKFTGLPIVRPSTWKGHLRFAAERVQEEQRKKEIIRRLFGAEDDIVLKGRLYFYPTFFEKNAERDVITPLSRETRTPSKGPIDLEVMKDGSNGTFHLFYIPYPKEGNFKEEQIKEDLNFLANALKLMFYTYGFSAKKTSGFGVINEKPSVKISIKTNEPEMEELKTKLENEIGKPIGDDENDNA